jgi:hypothetical protein
MDPDSNTPKKPPKLQPCPRVGSARGADEHLACPYCFGREAEVGTGERAKFCDYEPGVDPVCFGFPENCGTLVRG